MCSVVRNLPLRLSLLRMASLCKNGGLVSYALEEVWSMRREGPSTTFTVYFDGQFWVGVVERMGDSGLSAARVVFGAEPSDEEVFRFVLERWGALKFSPEVEAERRRDPGNPKRRQREAAKAAAKAAPSTKAQQALAKMREQDRATIRKTSAAAKREAAARKRALRAEKRKGKHRGH